LGRRGGAAAVQRFALEGFAARKRRHLQGRGETKGWEARDI
jgi:hypothetical protein